MLQTPAMQNTHRTQNTFDLYNRPDSAPSSIEPRKLNGIR